MVFLVCMFCRRSRVFFLRDCHDEGERDEVGQGKQDGRRHVFERGDVLHGDARVFGGGKDEHGERDEEGMLFSQVDCCECRPAASARHAGHV